MSYDDLRSALGNVDQSGLHDLNDDRLRVLWVMRALKGYNNLNGLTSAQISDLLRDGCGIALSRQRVAAILSNESGAVAKRKVGGKLHFRIMKSGEDLLGSSDRSTILVDPSKALSSIRLVEDILGALSGEVRVCDPYVDNRTLDFLAECEHANSIKLLTVNVYRENQFKRDLKAFKQEHGRVLDVRIFGIGELHDRYIIHEDGMLLIGASLNNLGMKQSFVVRAGGDIRASALSAFDKNWNRAVPYGS